ncbi:energy transducer TonB [Hymenobacter sp. BT770]|nr:energy transducer TonB [Hymenobacter sp. BT770]
MPELSEGGGQAGLVRAIQQRVKYPMRALRYGIQGQSEVSFVVAPDGSVRRVKIMRSLEADTDSAVVQAVRQLPRLAPGVQFGKSVACVLTAPITFQLDGLSRLARSKRPVPAADSLQLYTAVEQMPIYQGKLGYKGLAADLNAEYLRLRAESGCFVPSTNLGLLVTVGPGGTLYDVQRVQHDPKEYDVLRAEYGDAVAVQEEEDLPPACLALLAQAARNLPRVAPAFANGKRVAMRLQLTLLAPDK